MMPSGTVIRPAPIRARIQGRFASVDRRLKATAPTATKAAWQSETCADIFTSSDSDRNMIARPTACV